MSQLEAYPSRDSRPAGVRRLLTVLLFLLLALVLLAFLRRARPAAIDLEAALPGVGARTPVSVGAASPARGLLRLEVMARQDVGQGALEWRLAEETWDAAPWWAPWRDETSRADLEVEVGREVLPELAAGRLAEGEIEIVARATTAGSPWGGEVTVDESLVLEVRLVPPRIESVAQRDVARQGGAGLAVYRVDAGSVRDGVAVGELFFPGLDLSPAGEGSAGARLRYALFAVPHDHGDGDAVRLVAGDELGNEMRRPFLDRFEERDFPHDEIRVGESFLRSVVPEILAQTPSVSGQDDLVLDYVTINSELRRENQARLREIGASGGDEPLWEGAFLQMPGSRVMAGFGDRRTYLHDGEVIDRQTHLGYDLASVRRDEVPAAARGRVLLAEYFGIYGNTVVLDHGAGLSTLYSHLSEIRVGVGDRLERGEILGRTGETGLAGGDHLHFAVMVRGVQVDPLEWLDPRWVESRIEGKLERARHEAVP